MEDTGMALRLTNREKARVMRRLLVPSAAAVMLGLCGCAKDSGDKEGLGGSRGDVVETADFAAKGAPQAAVKTHSPKAAGAPAAAPTGAATMGAPTTRSDVFPIGGVRATGESTATHDPSIDPAPALTTTVGTPELENATAAKGTPTTVDAVVGQINGRPVFASEVLEPLDGRLRAASRKLTKRDERMWKEGVTALIDDQLQALINDELVLSAARASLTPDQKAGLLHFLKEIEGSIVSAQHGSEVEANDAARDQTGRGLHQEAEDFRDQELIKQEFKNKVLPHVMVPWRDVQNEYERRADKYNPPAEYRFRMVYTGGNNRAAIEKIEEAMSAGKSFEEIAKLPENDFIPKEGGLKVCKCGDAQGECTFHPDPDLNTALRTVGEGQTLGPVIYPPNKPPEEQKIAWVYLEKIVRPDPVSLYDAQLSIETELKVERFTTERERYLERLRKRGNVSNIEAMRDKLVTMATDRYAPQFSTK
jgi:hypothetical protein